MFVSGRYQAIQIRNLWKCSRRSLNTRFQEENHVFNIPKKKRHFGIARKFQILNYTCRKKGLRKASWFREYLLEKSLKTEVDLYQKVYMHIFR